MRAEAHTFDSHMGNDMAVRLPKLQRPVLSIRMLNDKLRQTFRGGRVVVTSSISAWPDHVQCELFRQVQNFNQFTPDNDPRGEHDFGSIDLDWGGYRERILWKIDAYDRELRFGSPDPADPAKTTRVLTIMLGSEW